VNKIPEVFSPEDITSLIIFILLFETLEQFLAKQNPNQQQTT
jgi:hypothetical protein